MLTLARLADTSLPPLLALTLVALLTSITAVGVLTALLGLACLLLLLHPATRPTFRFPLGLPFLAYVTVSLVSATVSAAPAASLFHAKDLLSIVLFFAAVNGFTSGAQIRRALVWFFAAVAVVSVYAMLQTWACTTAIPPPASVATLLKVQLERCRHTGIEPFRAKGLFSIYMTLGGSLVVALSLLLARVAFQARHRPTMLVPTALGFVALGLTYVRNAWIGVLVAVGVLVVLGRKLVLILPIAIAAAAALVPSTPLHTKARSMFDPTSPSVTERVYFWEAGLRMVHDAPWLGLGPGGVKRQYPDYKNPAARRTGTSHLHNNVVQIAAERGLLGLAAWLSVWAAFFWTAGRIYGRLGRGDDDAALVAGSVAGVAGFLTAGLFEYNFGDSEVIGLVWLVMAFPFVVGAARKEEARRHPLWPEGRVP